MSCVGFVDRSFNNSLDVTATGNYMFLGINIDITKNITFCTCVKGCGAALDARRSKLKERCSKFRTRKVNGFITKWVEQFNRACVNKRQQKNYESQILSFY